MVVLRAGLGWDFSLPSKIALRLKRQEHKEFLTEGIFEYTDTLVHIC